MDSPFASFPFELLLIIASFAPSTFALLNKRFGRAWYKVHRRCALCGSHEKGFRKVCLGEGKFEFQCLACTKEELIAYSTCVSESLIGLCSCDMRDFKYDCVHNYYWKHDKLSMWKRDGPYYIFQMYPKKNCFDWAEQSVPMKALSIDILFGGIKCPSHCGWTGKMHSFYEHWPLCPKRIGEKERIYLHQWVSILNEAIKEAHEIYDKYQYIAKVVTIYRKEEEKVMKILGQTPHSDQDSILLLQTVEVNIQMVQQRQIEGDEADQEQEEARKELELAWLVKERDRLKRKIEASSVK